MGVSKDSKDVPWGGGVLDAYLDGELDDSEREAVERHLLNDAKAAAYVSSGRQIRRDLHRLFDGRLATPLPPAHVELGLAIERETNRVRHRPRIEWLRFPVQLAAAAALAIVMLGAIALGLHAMFAGPEDQDLFALFSPEISDDAAGGLQPATDDQTPDATLAVGDAAALDEDTGSEPSIGPGAPDFSPFGFDLVSARLLSNSDDNGMQLIYESETGTRVELFYSPDAGGDETSLTVMDEGPVTALFWRTAGRSYSLIGDVTRETILEMGSVVDGDWTVPLPGATTGMSASEPEPPATTSDGVTEDIPAAGGESL